MKKERSFRGGVNRPLSSPLFLLCRLERILGEGNGRRGWIVYRDVLSGPKDVLRLSLTWAVISTIDRWYPREERSASASSDPQTDTSIESSAESARRKLKTPRDGSLRVGRTADLWSTTPRSLATLSLLSSAILSFGVGPTPLYPPPLTSTPYPLMTR